VRRALTESNITVKARCQSWIVASMVSLRPSWAWAELPRSRLAGPVRHEPRTWRPNRHIRRFRNISVVDPGLWVDWWYPSTGNQPRSVNQPR
jgi:hypothetical protein